MIENPKALTAIMLDEGIRRIEFFGLGHFVVEMNDGRFGSGRTVNDAWIKAKADKTVAQILKEAV